MLTQHKILITNTPYKQNILKALKNTSLAQPIQHGYHNRFSRQSAVFNGFSVGFSRGLRFNSNETQVKPI